MDPNMLMLSKTKTTKLPWKLKANQCGCLVTRKVVFSFSGDSLNVLFIIFETM